MKRRPTYRTVDREEVPAGNPIDLTVHRRVGGARLQREHGIAAADASRLRKATKSQRAIAERIVQEMSQAGRRLSMR